MAEWTHGTICSHRKTSHGVYEVVQPDEYSPWEVTIDGQRRESFINRTEAVDACNRVESNRVTESAQIQAQDRQSSE